MSPNLNELLARTASLENEIVSLTQDLIHAKTENDGSPESGNEILAAPIIEEALAGTEVITRRLARTPNRTNVLARLRGRSGKARLAFLCHSDVVPAGDLSGWQYDPFAGTLVDGCIYGRGASDMKGIAASQLMALKILAQSDVEPEHDLLFVCAADEEGGGSYGMGWLAAHHPDEVRADFALNEGGGAFLPLGDNPHFAICLGEKGRLRVTFHLRGKGAHAATPWAGENALYRLQQLLELINAQDWGLDLSLPYFRNLAQLTGWDEEVTDQSFARFIDHLSLIDPNLAHQARASAMHTFTPTVAGGGSASNSVPDQAKLVCDIRLVPGLPLHDVEQTLHDLVAAVPGTTVEIERIALPNTSETLPEFIHVVESALERIAGGTVGLVPALTTGFTDGRFLRKIGVPVYNFAPGSPSSGLEPRRAHGPDEFTKVQDLMFRTKFYLSVAHALLW